MREQISETNEGHTWHLRITCRRARGAAERASAAADLKARQSSARNEAWEMAGKEYAFADQRETATRRLIELEEKGLLTKEERDQTVDTLTVRPPAPTHEEQRAAIEAKINGSPLDAKNMSPELFAAMWAAAGKSK
jgi:hypothetical protein